MPGRSAFGSPGGDVLHILLGDLVVVALAEGRFEHDADRKREPLQAGQSRFFQCVEAVDDVFLVPNF